MKSLFIKLLTGHGGRIKSALTAGLVWLITWTITKFGIKAGEDWASEIATISALAVGWALESIAAKIGVDGVKAIQAEMPQARVSADGHAGPITIGAIKELVTESGMMAPETAAIVTPEIVKGMSAPPSI